MVGCGFAANGAAGDFVRVTAGGAAGLRVDAAADLGATLGATGDVIAGAAVAVRRTEALQAADAVNAVAATCE